MASVGACSGETPTEAWNVLGCDFTNWRNFLGVLPFKVQGFGVVNSVGNLYKMTVELLACTFFTSSPPLTPQLTGFYSPCPTHTLLPGRLLRSSLQLLVPSNTASSKAALLDTRLSSFLIDFSTHPFSLPSQPTSTSPALLCGSPRALSFAWSLLCSCSHPVPGLLNSPSQLFDFSSSGLLTL